MTHAVIVRRPQASSTQATVRRVLLAVLVLSLGVSLAAGRGNGALAASSQQSLWPAGAVPRVTSASDRQAVELGMRFSATVSGTVVGVRFYKGRANTGRHYGRLWTSDGRRLASVKFSRETPSGWQQATFPTPVRIEASRPYVVSYHAPKGGYAIDEGYFAGQAASRGALAAPASTATAGNGLFRYGTGGFPSSTWKGSNYWVDVIFRPDASAPSPSPSPTGATSLAPTPTPAPSTAQPPSTSTATATPSTSAPVTSAPTATSTPTGAVAGSALDLPRVPWEGGPAYYRQFAATAGTEWTSPSFFPITYWGAYVNERGKILNDAALGINSFSEIYAPDAANSARWMREAGIWNLGYDPGGAGAEHVGHMLPDEADMWAGYGSARWTGRYGFQSGVCDQPNVGCAPDMFRTLESRRSASDGRLRYYNAGKAATMWQSRDIGARFINGETWPVSMASTSLYFYTDGNLHGGDPALPGEATTFFGVPRDQIRRAANYGELAMTRLRELDARDGRLQPLSALVELGQQTGTTSRSAFEFSPMTPDRIEGAVWSSLIHEARGVTYFSHAFGAQPTSDALNHPPGDAHYDAVKSRVRTINAQVTALAPILNTQSYQWTFNPGVSTMLKEYRGSYYVFAMQKRSAATAGTFTFTLPAGMPRNGSVEVVNEGRSLPLVDGRFTDSFAHEFSHHTYRIG